MQLCRGPEGFDKALSARYPRASPEAASVSTSCSQTLLSTVAKRLSAASPAAPAWSDAEIGLSTLNSKVHYWGERQGQAIVAGRAPFTAPNGGQRPVRYPGLGGQGATGIDERGLVVQRRPHRAIKIRVADDCSLSPQR